MLIKAEDEEKAKESIFEIGSIDFEHPESISIEEVDWDLITEVPDGNRNTPFIEDLYIKEE